MVLEVDPAILGNTARQGQYLGDDLSGLLHVQDRGLVAATAVICAGEDGYDGLAGVEALEDGLVAADDGHEVVVYAETVGPVLREFVVLGREMGTALVRK